MNIVLKYNPFATNNDKQIEKNENEELSSKKPQILTGHMFHKEVSFYMKNIKNVFL